MSEFKMRGVMKVINDTVQITDKFQKREFILNEPDEKYPQDISFQLTQNNCEKLDQIAEGQEVEVCFRIRGREYQGKYFNNLEAWRVDAIEGANVTNTPPVVVGDINGADDALPF
jgi:single-strand DNA-binding protein